MSPFSPALSFASKDGAPDNLVAIMVDHREVYLLGEVSSEVWIDAGTFPFPFQRIPGTSTQHGIAAKFSIARIGNSFAYVSKNNRGDATIVQMEGYIPKRISTHAVENSLEGQTISDAVAWSYQLEGHEVYVVSFPTLQLLNIPMIPVKSIRLSCGSISLSRTAAGHPPMCRIALMARSPTWTV